MQVWTKTTADGKTVELTFDERTISIKCGGRSVGTCGRVARLDAHERQHMYKHAPEKDSRGRPITHAIFSVLLTEDEGRECEAIFAAECKRYNERLDRERLELYSDKIAEAKRTGSFVVLESWMTDRCHNGRGDECSFDSAERRIDDTGRIWVDYQCCY